ncbi:MAG: dTMP kinase [Actinomycetota bacterium]
MGLSLPRREEKSSYLQLLRNFSFSRFVTAIGFSSLGDWIGMIAILALVRRITDDEFAVAAMLLARFLPALVFGPVAGVLVDRWNRKAVMVACDVGRAALISTLPFLDSISRATSVDRIVLLLLISAALEMTMLMWQPAKDASLPGMLEPHQLTHANSLISLAAYGTFPLSGVMFSLLVPASRLLGRTFEFMQEFRLNEEHLAFYFDAFTFLVSAGITATLVIPRRPKVRQRLNLRRAWHEFIDGIRFIGTHPRIRPWIFGIGMIYAGVGTFLAIAVFYVSDVLGAGGAGTGLLVTAIGTGLGVGFVSVGVAARLVPRDVLFTGSVLGIALSLVVFASVSTLTAGLLVAVGLGLFAGLAYPSALTLLQESVDDEIRGRVLASGHSVIRLALVGSLALAPALAKLIGDGAWVVLGQHIDLRGTRVVLWGGAVLIAAAGLVTARAVVARWRGLAAGLEDGRRIAGGLFIVFEGGEGAGKSTQIARLASFLESRGRRVVVTREPGGTKIGERIRDLLLDPASAEMQSKTEALLYAADRAQHVEEVIVPSLEQGSVVISDRYLDSSLAYQGLARGLGVEEVSGLNRWGTAGLLPDLVFYLDYEPDKGLERSGVTDRIEMEDVSFHSRVREAYHLLAGRHAERFVVVEGSLPPDEIAESVRRRVEEVLESE